MATEDIFDRCEALSLADRKWYSIYQETRSIDQTVKSPLGTGSIKVDVPPTAGVYNTILFCEFAPEKDFTTKRPKSVFIYSLKAMQFMLEIICRPDESWLERYLTGWVNIPANTMVELSADYSGVPLTDLQEVFQLRVFAKTDQQAATFYVSGITQGMVAPECSIDSDCVTKYGPGYVCQSGICARLPTPPTGPYSTLPLHTVGKDILNSAGIKVNLRGIGWLHTEDDPTFWCEAYGAWNTQAISNRLSWLHDQGINFIKIFVTADWILHNPVSFSGSAGTVTVDYLQNIEDLCTIADSWGIYVEVCFHSLLNGKDMYTNNYPRSNTPYSPYINSTDAVAVPNTAAFNQAVSILSVRLTNHRNALLGIWNEPGYNTGKQTEYDNYFTQLPITMQAIRTAGFNDIIVVMGSVAFTPGSFWIGGNDDMTWAINHGNLFTNYGSVIADFHTYHCFLNQYGMYPDDYNELKNLWLNTGRILEAQNLGICVAYFEGGVRVTDANIAQQNVAYANALKICNEQEMSYVGWVYSSTDPFSMLSSQVPPIWNSSGLALKNAITPTPPLTATIQGYIRDQGGTPIVDATVTCDGYTNITEIDGAYAFVGIPAKAYTLTVTMIGYEPASIGVDASAGGTFGLDISLQPVVPHPPTPLPATLIGASLLGVIAILEGALE